MIIVHSSAFSPNQVAAFMAAHMDRLSATYITQADIDAGRSTDGVTWVSDLIGVLADEIASVVGDKVCLVAHTSHFDTPYPVLRGVLIATCHGELADVEDIVIHADYRGSGVGRALLDKFCNIAKSRGCVEAEGHINPGNRGSLIAAQSWGFEHVGDTRVIRKLK